MFDQYVLEDAQMLSKIGLHFLQELKKQTARPDFDESVEQLHKLDFVIRQLGRECLPNLDPCQKIVNIFDPDFKLINFKMVGSNSQLIYTSFQVINASQTTEVMTHL